MEIDKRWRNEGRQDGFTDETKNATKDEMTGNLRDGCSEVAPTGGAIHRIEKCGSGDMRPQGVP